MAHIPDPRPAPPGPVSNPQLPPDEERDRARDLPRPDHSGNGVHPHQGERPENEEIADNR